MGTSNKGMKTDDEELNIPSEEGNEATQETKNNEEQHIATTGENSGSTKTWNPESGNGNGITETETETETEYGIKYQ